MGPLTSMSTHVQSWLTHGATAVLDQLEFNLLFKYGKRYIALCLVRT